MRINGKIDDKIVVLLENFKILVKEVCFLCG